MCCFYLLSPNLLGLGPALMQVRHSFAYRSHHALTHLTTTIQCFSRYQTRERYEIRGDVVQDALISAFCGPCQLLQEARYVLFDICFLRMKFIYIFSNSELADEEQALKQGEGVDEPETLYHDEPDV